MVFNLNVECLMICWFKLAPFWHCDWLKLKGIDGHKSTIRILEIAIYHQLDDHLNASSQWMIKWHDDSPWSPSKEHIDCIIIDDQYFEPPLIDQECGHLIPSHTLCPQNHSFCRRQNAPSFVSGQSHYRRFQITPYFTFCAVPWSETVDVEPHSLCQWK